MKQRDWQATLVRIAVVLGILLVVLVSIALLYVVAQVFLRIGNVVALFILGAIMAYVLNPGVTWFTVRVGKRWVGTLVVYVGVALGVALLAISVVQPLATESSSLVRALQHPAAGSVQALSRIATRSHALGIELRSERVLSGRGVSIPVGQVRQVRAAITGIQVDLAALEEPPLRVRAHSGTRTGGVAPTPQIRVPPSYLAPVQRATAALASDYQQAVRRPAAPGFPALSRSVVDADRITLEAQALHTDLATTPILLLDAQTWADQHYIQVNVAHSAGQVVRQITSQTSSLLNNTGAILSQTATLLLDLVLVLIISVYFVIDGERMIQRALEVVPDAYHRQATFFVESLNAVLGGYIRAQILLALVAGTLGGLGAAMLGVPYALVIGVSTFALQLLPVVGPMLVYITPMVIALLFTAMPTPLVLLAYFIVFEQVVTNIIGPRVNSKSVGIHPLEAMAAALLAYPVAGVLGSFLAVPLVGLAHVVAKEARTSWRSAAPSSGPSTARRDFTQGDSSLAASAGLSDPARDGSPQHQPLRRLAE